MNKVLKRLFSQTLKSKIRIILFSVGFSPFILILIYLQDLGKDKMIKDTIEIRHAQITIVKKSIESLIHSLKKEVYFLSSLEIMNDVIVEDIDKRIRTLIVHKKQDLAYDVEIYVINSKNHVVASAKEEEHKDFIYADKIVSASEEKKDYFFANDTLFIFAPIRTSLQKDQTVGSFIIAYPLKNLTKFIVSDKSVRTLFYFPQSMLWIGSVNEIESSNPYFYTNDYITEEYLILNEHFNGIFTGAFMVYMIKKSVALSFLNQFMWFIWMVGIFGFLILAVLSWWIGDRIIKPIQLLSDGTQKILNSQDYTTQVSVSSEGEIRELAENFNRMIREIDKTLTMLEMENRFRVLRFVQLINIFNNLITTTTKEECIDITLEQLGELIPEQHFSFAKENSSQYDLPLYVKDYVKGTRDYYGSILINNKEIGLDVNEDKFYQSIAKMIMLQLDQISLISQIHTASESKSVFISHMSHELRTPLHAILSATQYLIGYEDLSAPQQGKIANIESAAGHLLRLINDILDLAQIEAGKVFVKKVNVDIKEISSLIEEVIQVVDLLAEQKNTKISFINNVEAPSTQILIDRKYFKQILINLLSNAIKFTDNGTIEIDMELSQKQFVIHVTDDGIGLSEEELSLLFDSFTQIHNEGMEKGNGLGLVISKKLAQLFDADVDLESPGKGLGTTSSIYLSVV